MKKLTLLIIGLLISVNALAIETITISVTKDTIEGYTDAKGFGDTPEDERLSFFIGSIESHIKTIAKQGKPNGFVDAQLHSVEKLNTKWSDIR